MGRDHAKLLKLQCDNLRVCVCVWRVVVCPTLACGHKSHALRRSLSLHHSSYLLSHQYFSFSHSLIDHSPPSFNPSSSLPFKKHLHPCHGASTLS